MIAGRMNSSAEGRIVSRNAKWRLFAELALLKALYILSTALLLPDDFLLWPWGKRVYLPYLVPELIPFSLACALFIHQYREGSAYSFFNSIFFVLFFIPANSCLSLSTFGWDFYVLINLFSILLMWICGFFALSESSDGIHGVSDGARLEDALWSNRKLIAGIRFAALAVCALELLLVYSYNGLDFSVLWNSAMYDTRAEYAENIASIRGSTTSYFILIITHVSQWMLPLYLYFALARRKYLDVAICVFVFVADFTMAMVKTSIFIILVVFFVLYLRRTDNLRRAGSFFRRAFLLLFLVSLAEYAISGQSLVFNLLIRREACVPMYLFHIYYDFFSEHPHLWFRQDTLLVQNILGVFVSRPYPRGTVEIISEYCFNGWLPSPNTGIFAEAYAQMGLPGIFLFPFMDVLIVWTMRKAASVFGPGVQLVVLVRLALLFQNSFILVSSNMVGILVFVAISAALRSAMSHSRRIVSGNGGPARAA